MWWHVTVLSAIWFGDIYSGTFVGLIDSEPTLFLSSDVSSLSHISGLLLQQNDRVWISG